MKIEVVHSLSPETLEILQALVGKVIHNSTSNGTGSAKSTPATETGAVEPWDKAEPKSSKKVNKVEKKDEEKEPTLTIAAVRVAMDEAKERGVATTKIKALLADFGVDRSTNLDPKQYTDFIEKVKSL